MRSGAHEGLMCPLENGISGINKSSSDDRPGPGICDSKYVEDAKAARSVRVWDRVPMKTYLGEIGIGHQMPGRSWRAMRLLGFTNLVESAWLFSFLRCEAILLATMNLLL